MSFQQKIFCYLELKTTFNAREINRVFVKVTSSNVKINGFRDEFVGENIWKN